MESSDVLIIGAGLSGIGAACQLKRQCPGKSVVILEGRDAIGGTWDLFRYPGIRSDTDMYTLGYAFRPWSEGKAIADGPSIRKYIRETAAEYGVDQWIRYGHKVIRAAWSSADQYWTVTAVVGGEERQFRCRFLHCCTGYYNYDQGYQPDYPGQADFAGRLIHPQHWPQDLDYRGKRVVIIGSGATAVTLVPSMAPDAAHVTMLQRSPSYVLSLPQVDAMAQALNRVLPHKWAYFLTRWKNIGLSIYLFKMSRAQPHRIRAWLRQQVVDAMGPDYPVDVHFNPSYNPFEQRLCFMPDGDLFDTIKSGRAEIVTEHIDTFTETGIRLRDGRELEADIIVSATGLELLPMGGIETRVDGEQRPINETLIYKGMMVGDVPNYAFTTGYTNAPWTLKADLVSQFVCRLLNYMDRKGYQQCTPRPTDDVVGSDPLIDFSSSYVQRAQDRMPKQGKRAPWRLYQNYIRDRLTLRHGRLKDGAMEFV